MPNTTKYGVYYVDRNTLQKLSVITATQARSIEAAIDLALTPRTGASLTAVSTAGAVAGTTRAWLTDGTEWVWSGSKWLFAGGGAPSCIAGVTTVYNPGSGWNTIAWDRNDYISHVGMHSVAAGAGATNNKRFIAPYDGIYHVDANVQLAVPQGGTVGLRLMKSGVVETTTETVNTNGSTNSSPSATLATDIMLLAGQHMEVQVYQSTATNLQETKARVSMHLVRTP